MAYGVKYRFPFQSVEGVDWTIDILKDGYSGSILTRAIGGSPILRRTGATIYAERPWS